VLLLDAPKKRIVNDAARAKDRVVDLDIKAVTPETLTELRGLPGMRVEGFAVEEQEGQEYLHLFCKHCHEVAICPRCGEAMVGGYDSEERSVRHLDIWGIRTIIHFSRRRASPHKVVPLGYSQIHTPWRPVIASGDSQSGENCTNT